MQRIIEVAGAGRIVVASYACVDLTLDADACPDLHSSIRFTLSKDEADALRRALRAAVRGE